MRQASYLFALAAASSAAFTSALVAPAPTNTVEKANVNFQKYRSVFPENFDVVNAGGWNAVKNLSSDPKSELVSLVISRLKDTDGKIDTNEDGKVDALVGILHSRGMGYDSSLVDGEWSMVLSREGKKSPKFQKVVDKQAKAKTAYSAFDVAGQTFSGINYTPRGNGKLWSEVKFNPVAENFDVDVNGNIVIRRIACDIVGASFKYWKLPTVQLPLRAKGGYLDFIYMDEDIRITKGNRGGLFVHFRPDFLEQAMNA